MFFPSTRLFVAGNSKAAGTTLRWSLLAAHGVDVRARDENTQLLGEVEHLKNREHELLDSTSWRVTGPLRWVGDKAKR
jgi:hypothetical protein